MGKWIEQEGSDIQYDDPWKIIGQFMDYLYEHDFELVIEGNLWNTIFPRSKL